MNTLFKFAHKYKTELILLVTIVTSVLLAYFLLRNQALYIDEHAHFLTISELYSGNMNSMTFARHSQFPGYHYLLVAFKMLTGLSSFAALRLFQTGISILTIGVFYLIVRKVDFKQRLIKTVLFAFMPITFAYYSLIYTDLLALLLLLVTYWFLISKRYTLAGLAGWMSVLVRQNNVIWLTYFLVYDYMETYKWQVNKTNLIAYVKKVWIFAIPFLIVAGFFAIFRRLTILEQTNATIPLYLHNLWLLLFVHFFLFLPENIANVSKVVQFVKQKKQVLFVLLLVFLAYWFTFSYETFFPANDRKHLVTGIYNLTNVGANLAVLSPYNKLIFFLPMAYAILSLCVTKFNEKRSYLLYLFSFLYLIPNWLIELRYLIVPIAFFILYKKTSKVDYLNLSVFIVITLVIMYGLTTFTYFP